MEKGSYVKIMILEAFAKYLKEHESRESPFILLSQWLKFRLQEDPTDNVGKILHTELQLMETEDGKYAIIAKSPSGQVLLETLHKYVNSLENQKFSRWVHSIKPSDFNPYST